VKSGVVGAGSCSAIAIGDAGDVDGIRAVVAGEIEAKGVQEIR